jgi:SprT protein
MRARVENEVKRYVALATKKTGRHYNVPLVKFDLRGRTAGVARGTHTVDFNPILLMENPEEYFGETIAHEVAHCIDTANGDNQSEGIRFDRYGRMRRAKRSIHGPSWKHIMRNIFGVEPQRTHDMDTTNAQVRVKTKFEYQCKCCNKSLFVSSVRHNKQRRYELMNPGKSFYTCKRCGRERGQLRFIANRGQVSYEQAREAAQQKTPVRFTDEHIPPSKLPPALKQKVMDGTRSSKDIAVGIMARYGGHLTRGQFIVRAVEAGMKETTASTYYAQLRRRA